MTEIYLIRHGQAQGNTMRRFHGHYNTPLTLDGMRQAEYLRKRFERIELDACYSSDLLRPCMTAQPLCRDKGLPLHRDARFREIGVGIWEDLPSGWLWRTHADHYKAFDRDPLNWHISGGESFDDSTQRFLEGMEQAVQEHDGGAIAIFCHAAIIRRVLIRLFSCGDPDQIKTSDNTSVTKLTCSNGTYQMVYANDISHLPPELTTAHLIQWWTDAGSPSGQLNLFFLPFTGKERFPEEMRLPEMDSRGRTLTAMMNDVPVGIVSMAAPDGDRGEILGMMIREDGKNRHYEDQLLGAAVSHYRLLGCRSLKIRPEMDWDGILTRYGYDPVSGTLPIDPESYERRYCFA